MNSVAVKTNYTWGVIAWKRECGGNETALSLMLNQHLCWLWLGAFWSQGHWDCNSRWGCMQRTRRISSIPDIIRLNRVNSLLRLIQTVKPWPCCILSVNSSSNSLFYYPTDWQAGTLSHTHTDRLTEGPIIIVSDFCAELQLCQTVLDKNTHTHTHTHAHLRTPLSTAVGGKTAQPTQSSSNLTGIKWPLHRGSHVCACMHVLYMHTHTHTHTHNNNRGEMNVRQQENWTGNHPSIHKEEKKKLHRRCQSLNYVKILWLTLLNNDFQIVFNKRSKWLWYLMPFLFLWERQKVLR